MRLPPIVRVLVAGVGKIGIGGLGALDGGIGGSVRCYRTRSWRAALLAGIVVAILLAVATVVASLLAYHPPVVIEPSGEPVGAPGIPVGAPGIPVGAPGISGWLPSLVR